MDPASETVWNETVLWPPGTVVLEDAHREGEQLVFLPTPSSDPDDPLNWSTARKAVNFALASFFVLWTFVELDIVSTSWGPMESELNYSVALLNSGMAVNYGGLAVGSMLFIPLVHKFGRRPIYIFSISLQLASCIWYARMSTAGDLIGSSLISGLGGAISEIIMQITVADIFFVHQHATMNSLFVVFESVGAFLGPVASGYVIVSQGWRWIWWWCVIFIGITLLCVLLFFEESKYVQSRVDQTLNPLSEEKEVAGVENVEESEAATNHASVNHLIKTKSYRQRMALITPTGESIWPHFLQPIATLLMFPAVTYCAITYATSLCWFAIMTSVQATYLIQPPYDFNATGIGLMNLGPFVGTVIGTPFGGYLCDRLIIHLSKRNGGIYEPEMRLWVALPVAISCPGGILMFGLGLSYGAHWAVLATGFGLWGFSLAIISCVTLSYLMDCYQDIIGDVMIGVIFMRNILSLIVLFVLTPWISGMGVRNVHVILAVIAFAIYLLPVPLIIWGKRARVATAARYKKMTENQLGNRMIERS